ncbi:MAG TPA: HNH endonuclease [Pirellulaceae bacterium]|nr:HNH endonuclease [Pirellulaceae bacterium]
MRRWRKYPSPNLVDLSAFRADLHAHLPWNSTDGKYGPDLHRLARRLQDEGYFIAESVDEEHNRVLREVAERRGQDKFRNALIAAYDGHCAITGCDAVPALEAAHITPFGGAGSDDVRNGLLLRADIHTLFDLNLLGIEPESLAITLAERLLGTFYADLSDRKLLTPVDSSAEPNFEALRDRCDEFRDCNYGRLHMNSSVIAKR